MIRCPFCHFENEDGALFCEQCKSDLASVEPFPVGEPVEVAVPIAEPEILETVPVVSVPEGMPIVEAVLAEPYGMATEATPLEGLIPLAPDVPPLQPLHAEPQILPNVPVAQPAIPVMTPAPSTMPGIPAVAPPTMTPSGLASAVAQSPILTPVGTGATALPTDAQPRLQVLRGLKRNLEYPIYEGLNFIGRADEKPVDIDLDDQEPPDRVWSSRQHALITYENGNLVIEDLNSSNGTFVNRTRIYPGQKKELTNGDVIQIGTVQLKLLA